jgi:hypothetical protein
MNNWLGVNIQAGEFLNEKGLLNLEQPILDTG